MTGPGAQQALTASLIESGYWIDTGVPGVYGRTARFEAITGGFDALVQRFAMEWFWRMASNPRRLGRRYWDCARVLAAMTGPALKARARARHG